MLAAKAGVEHVNEAGAIAGRTVVDDRGEPTLAVTKLREALPRTHPIST